MKNWKPIFPKHAIYNSQSIIGVKYLMFTHTTLSKYMKLKILHLDILLSKQELNESFGMPMFSLLGILERGNCGKLKRVNFLKLYI